MTASNPEGSLIADADGNLLGTTSSGGANANYGTESRSQRLPRGYASTPTTLVSFDFFVDGANPLGSLIADSNGDLFGTTSKGGAAGENGTVFEIAKTAGGYASTATTLVTFDGEDGSSPLGSLFADSNGDLFGTTEDGGANDLGTVYSKSPRRQVDMRARQPYWSASTATTAIFQSGA